MINEIIRLLPSDDLKEKIKATNYQFTESELLQIIYNYAPTFFEKLSMLEQFSAKASPDVAALAKVYTGINFERCELEDNTVRLCFDGAENITFDFTNKTLKGDIWYHKNPEEYITPIFSPTNLDVVLGRFVENDKPACGLKFRKEGGFDAFSACAPIPVELLREIYKYANVFMYADKLIPVYTSASFECVYHYDGGIVKLYRPKAAVLTDCFTGEQHVLDKKGKDFSFEPHETKYFIVEEKDSVD